MFCSKCGTENKEGVNFCKSCGNQIGNSVNATITNEELVLPASLLQRFLHNIVDIIAMYVFAFVVGFASSFLFGETTVFVLSITAFFSYHLIFEALFQKTIGKMLTGTKVVNMQGERPSFLALLGRTLARHIPFEPLSFLFYGAYPTQGWHDRLSRTLVVPKALTPEDVQRIDSEKIRRQKYDNKAGIIIVIIAVSLLFIMIIGIISSVVLASLEEARNKSRDAGIKSILSRARVEAELYYEKNLNSYSDFCIDEQMELLFGKTFGDKSINYVCNDSSSEYAVSAPVSEGGYYCVDNKGDVSVVGYGLTNQTSCSGIPTIKSLPKELKEVEEYVNSMYDLPAMIDEEVRLDRIYASYDNKMNFDYTMVNFTADELEWSSGLEDTISSGLISYFCEDSSFEYYREKNIPIKWNYYGMNKGLIGSVEASNTDCI
ncbi:MAG: hypothetical protein COV70_01020 [Parcubacteria group bacterium CG11_big_fil_rev_8_21_14_0_20_39_22]|nr:MAG: hypothetical protein COV70_01020 [Parcubacteria group bacterium CG11_big_fil_rev_8_21_14_0_20_39_22]